MCVLSMRVCVCVRVFIRLRVCMCILAIFIAHRLSSGPRRHRCRWLSKECRKIEFLLSFSARGHISFGCPRKMYIKDIVSFMFFFCGLLFYLLSFFFFSFEPKGANYSSM